MAYDNHTVTFIVVAMVCVQDVEQELLDQTASPDAAASTAVAVTSGLGLATVLQALLELTAAQVSQETLLLCVPHFSTM